MAVGDIISVARYNVMQDRANKVLGVGGGAYGETFGYGQSVASSSLPTNVATNPTVVNSTHMQNLKTDIVKAYVHQQNTLPTLTDVNTSDDITDAVYVEYETASTRIETDHLLYNINQMTVPESKLSVSRNTTWGQPGLPTIIHEWSVTWTDNNHLRAFFNSGGEVRHRASLSGGSGTKTTNWTNMISTVGTVKFSYTDTVGSSGTDYNIGAYDLTPGASYVNIWYYEPGAGAYENNNITYKAKMNSSSNVITFRVEYTDGEAIPPGDGTPGVDEPVEGTLTSIVEQQRATGSYVEVPTPNYSNILTL